MSDDTELDALLKNHESLCQDQTQACGDCRRLKAAINRLIEKEVRRNLDLLYWQYKENNHQSVDMTFVDAYNAVIAELEAGSGEAAQ